MAGKRIVDDCIERLLLSTALAIVSLGKVVLPAQSQTPTVGNATITPVSPSASEAYGVTSPFSTHQRMGESTGIGGSYLGTESVTSESRARVRTRFNGSSAPEVHEIRLHVLTGSDMPSTSPGLQGPDVSSVGETPWTGSGFQVRHQSSPDFSFQNRQSPALQEIRFGGSDYSLGQFK